MNRKVRIGINDTTRDAIIKLSEGNPGATVVCMEILKHGEEIDPDSALGGLGHLLILDTLGIYGHRIWQLYKDVCKQNLVTTIALLRAVQIGKLGEDKLQFAIENYGKGIDVDDLHKQVRQILPGFSNELIIKESESISVVKDP